MREIKFRAWVPKDKIMYTFDNYGMSWLSLERKSKGDTEGMMKFYSHPNVGWHEGFIMQFTGLKDKNGKEIYDGDVIRTTRIDEDGEVVETWQVFWSSDMGGWWLLNCENGESDTLYACNDTYKAEVIGNIYENPSLLESK